MKKYQNLTLVVLTCAYFWYYGITYTDWHFIDSVNLIFHEAGHSIFSFFGMFIKIAAGSGFQVLLPILICIYFFYLKQYISGSLCLLWIGQNLLNVSMYANDAVSMQLDILGGDSVVHDWNYLLGSLGLLPSTQLIASSIYSLGWLFIFVGTVVSLYYSWADRVGE